LHEGVSQAEEGEAARVAVRDSLRAARVRLLRPTVRASSVAPAILLLCAPGCGAPAGGAAPLPQLPASAGASRMGAARRRWRRHLCWAERMPEADHPRSRRLGPRTHAGRQPSSTARSMQPQDRGEAAGIVEDLVRQGERRRTAVFLNVTEKPCFVCGRVLPLGEFTADRSKRLGVGTYCRECDARRGRERYARDRERILAKAAAKRGPQPTRHCLECGCELEGKERVCCGTSKCREARFRRLRPESYARREAAKVDRRRERRRSATKA
jgi:hypothetical protein